MTTHTSQTRLVEMMPATAIILILLHPYMQPLWKQQCMTGYNWMARPTPLKLLLSRFPLPFRGTKAAASTITTTQISPQYRIYGSNQQITMFPWSKQDSGECSFAYADSINRNTVPSCNGLQQNFYCFKKYLD